MSDDENLTNELETGGEAGLLDSLKVHAKNGVSFVVQNGPGFLEKTRLNALAAYRRGAQALSTNALASSGVDVRSGAIALGLTLAFFAVTNLVLSFWVSSAFHGFKPEFLETKNTLVDVQSALKQERWDVSSDDTQVLQGQRDEEFELPLYRWVEIQFLKPSMDDGGAAADEFQKLAIGPAMNGVFFKNPRITTGNELFEELLRNKATNSRLRSIAKDVDRKHFCLAMLDSLIGATERPIRFQLALNGLIQMLTIFVGIFVLTALIRRWLFVTRLAERWLGENFSDSVKDNDSDEDRQVRLLVKRLGRSNEGEAYVRTEMNRVSNDTTKEIYESYWFLTGMMPSLGFIGTVVGMSSSLMLADEVFLSNDKQLAIGSMTTELGMAFDTTFVALVGGLLASIPITYVHSRERTFFRELTTRIIGIQGQVADMRRRKADGEPDHVK